MHSFNFSNNPIKDWHTDQNWLLLDPTVKGFFTQIVLSSSQTKPYGHITSNEKKIKKIIGIPHIEVYSEDLLSEFSPKKGDLQKTLKSYFDINETKGVSSAMLDGFSHLLGEEDLGENINYKLQHNYNMWLNFLWEQKWKKQLKNLMFIIDDEMVSNFPELEGKNGDYFVPIAYNLGFQNNNPSVFNNNEKPNVAVKRSKKKEKIQIIPHEDIYFELDHYLEVKEDSLQFINYDLTDTLSYKHVYKSLVRPLTEEDKSTIWDFGISLISISNDKKDIARARSIMAKAMKNYGKEAAISAITKMSLIKEKQLNPHAYFLKLLDIDKKENEEIERKTKSKIGSNNTFVML